MPGTLHGTGSSFLQADADAFGWIIRNLDDVVVLLDREGVGLYASPGIERMTGRPADEYLGSDMFAHIHPEDVDRVRERFAWGLAHPGERVSAEYRYQHADDSWRRLHSAGAYLAGSPRGDVFMVVTRDLTERQRAQEAQRVVTTIVDSSEDAIVTVTPDGIVTSWNPAAERILGWRADEVLGSSAASMIPPELLPVVMENVARVLQGEVLRGVEEDRLDRHGHRVPLSMTVFPLRTPHGELIGIGTIAHDLRDRKMAEQILAAQARTRRHVRRLLQDLARRNHLPPSVLRELGRHLAGEVDAEGLRGYAASFVAMGFGELSVREERDGRFTVEAADLLELRPNATQPTCHLALGFLEGAAGAVAGGVGLGAELHCQSMGDARCVFVVRARPRPGG